MVRSIKSKLILAGLAGLLAGLSLSCGEGAEPYPVAPSPSNTANQSGCGNVQGNGNTVNCVQPTPTPSPSASSCVASTAAFVCQKASPVFQSLLESVQAKVTPAPEPIYVANLVKALNEHLGADGKPDLCAASGPPLAGDEVAIKARVSNSMSETWDVVNASGAIQSLYVSVCNPARF